jgi:hypothetical protein
MRRSHSAPAKHAGRFVAVLATIVVVVLAAGCGSAAKPAQQRAAGAVGALGDQVASTGCSGGSSSASSHAVSYCVFVIADGRRFRCQGSAVAQSQQTASSLARAVGCVALRRLAISPASRAVFVALARVRACLIGRGYQVIGGPVLPPQGPNAPDGELTVGTRPAVPVIAFYDDPLQAARLEPAVIRRAKPLGGQVERRGAVTVVWLQAPKSALRARVQACAWA